MRIWRQLRNVFIEKHYSLKQQRVLQLLHFMQSHQVAFTWAFITSAFAVADGGDLVPICLDWPSPDAAAAVRASTQGIQQACGVCMYRGGKRLALIGLWEICGGLCSPTAVRQQEKSPCTIFLMSFHVFLSPKEEFHGSAIVHPPERRHRRAGLHSQ